MRAREFGASEPIIVVDIAAMALIVVWSLAWLLPGLNHPSIHHWDESFHQAVVRGTAAHFVPTMHEDPFYPLVLRYWWYAGVWMHKPAAVFWWGALWLKWCGVAPAALRSASLVGEVGSALLIYLFCRPLVGRVFGLLTSLAFAVLPFGWVMVQGHYVADVTDVTVTAFVTLGMAWLWWAVERDSWRWAGLAGAAIGVGYLCKTFLSLAPLGVAGAWWALAQLRMCKGPRLSQVLAMFAGFVVVAAPWNLIAWLKWNDEYMRALHHTLGFLAKDSGEDIGSGARPPDAIFNEINNIVMQVFPHAFTLISGLWLAIKAVRERDGRLWAISLWLWSTWIVHSMSHVKGHGHLWNAVPAILIAYAVTLRDCFRYRALATSVLASFAVWLARPTIALAATVREHLPSSFVQTKTWPDSGLVEQMLLVPATVIGVAFLGRALRLDRWPKVAVALGSACALVTGWYAFYKNPLTLSDKRTTMARERLWSSTRDLGLAIDPLIEPRSVLFMHTNLDYGMSHEYLSLMFWSGRQVHRRPPDVPLALSKGYHPYLVSPAAEPFEPVAGIPPWAPLRAYDLLKPRAEPAPVPVGLTPLNLRVGAMDAVGYSAIQVSSDFSRYAYYFAAHGRPSGVHVTYHLDDGTTVSQSLDLTSTLRSPDGLQGAWFVIPDVGPLHHRVRRIDLSP